MRILPTLRKRDLTILRFLDLVDVEDGFVLVLLVDLLKDRLILLVEVVDGFVVFGVLIESLDTFVVFLVDLVDTSTVLFIPFFTSISFLCFLSFDKEFASRR